MEKNTLIKVMNRSDGPVGYTLPEFHIRRQFEAGTIKELPFGEIEALYMTASGKRLMDKYLVIGNKEAREAIMPNVEPEYFYTGKDVKRMLTTATYDEFLDCLDFAPDGVIDIIKEMAVTLPCNDMKKRAAIQKKTGLDVTKAIEIRETKYDGDSEAVDEVQKPKRRVSLNNENKEPEAPARRTSTPKLTVNLPE